MHNIQSSVLNKLPAEDETCECDAVDFIKFCPDKQSSRGRQSHNYQLAAHLNKESQHRNCNFRTATVERKVK